MSQDKPVLSREQQIARQVWDEMELGFSFSQPQANDISRYTDEVVKRALERQGSGKWVPRDIHPLDNSKGDAVIQLLAHPPSAARFSDPNDYYDHWWSLLLDAAAPQAQDAQTGEGFDMLGELKKHMAEGPASGSPDNAVAPGERKPGEIASPRNDAKALDRASEERAIPSTAPDISALVGRLEQANPYIEPSEANSAMIAAVQALRALEAEYDHWIKMYTAAQNANSFRQSAIEAWHKADAAANKEVQALQHQLTLTRELLKECLDMLDEIGPLDRLAEIRKAAGL